MLPWPTHPVPYGSMGERIYLLFILGLDFLGDCVVVLVIRQTGGERDRNKMDKQFVIDLIIWAVVLVAGLVIVSLPVRGK